MVLILDKDLEIFLGRFATNMERFSIKIFLTNKLVTKFKYLLTNDICMVMSKRGLKAKRDFYKLFSFASFILIVPFSICAVTLFILNQKSTISIWWFSMGVPVFLVLFVVLYVEYMDNHKSLMARIRASKS